MANKFSSGKNTIADCDVCGQRFKLKQLKELVVKAKRINTLACPECWSPDHPQLMLGTFPVEDPQAVRNPRPDKSRVPTGIYSSRDTQWGWAPVGGASSFDTALTPNYLVATTHVGTVTIQVS